MSAQRADDGPSGPVPCPDDSDTWGALHTLACSAAKAACTYASNHLRGAEIPGSPFQRCGTWSFLKCDVGADWAQRNVERGWRKLFLAVDAALDTQDPRNWLELEYQRCDGRMLYLGVPETTAGRLPRSRHHVRVFQVNANTELARRWAQAVEDIDRGPAVVDLWTRAPAALPRRAHTVHSARPPLNEQQALAVAAMASPGGFFVWGPPGTGKTTVIARAIQDALDRDHAVLLTSHTHVAVDNALEALVKSDTPDAPTLLTPGRVVRKRPGALDKLTNATVLDHPFLLEDKAAATLVMRDERLAEADAAIRANLAHPDRARETELTRRLHELDPDDSWLRQIDKQLEAHEEWLARKDDHERLAGECEALLAQIEAARQDVDSFGDVEERYACLTEQTVAAAGRRGTARGRVNWLTHRLGAAIHQQEGAEAALNLKTAQRLIVPWARDAHQQEVASLQASCDAAGQTVAGLRTALAQAMADLVPLEARVAELAAAQTGLGIEREARERAARRLADLGAALVGHERATAACATRIDELRDLLGDADSWLDRYREAEDKGHIQLLRELEEAERDVAVLGAELTQHEERRAQVEEDFRAKRLDLLREAPVIATTLDSLMYSEELMKRRFDVVIIDEVASAEAVKVFYAASKADVTCALVGDFLQNSPVADADAPTNDDERETAGWQTSDIFALAGITDRDSAQAHPRCVALSRQYRFPPIIADAVNRLCYDNLLTSAQPDPEGIVITFHDTSRLTNLHFDRRDTSWQCRRTLELAEDIARAENIRPIGFITPYRAQAHLADRWFQIGGRRDLGLECGTAHRFQGREFGCVIVDLMQDAEPRWVSYADARTPDARAQGAAKLLNVAITRARTRLHLIGNWEFVRAQTTSGMRALAALAERDGFELVPCLD